jgi:hypothetical protein
MLQKTYSIYSDDLNDVQLFVEIGKNHIACWCKKKGDNKLQAFEFFQCDDSTAEDFEELIDNAKLYSRLLTMPAAGVNFFWNTNEVLCVPKEKDNTAFLQQNFELLSGSLPGSTIASKPTEHCLVAWRIENKKQKTVTQCFPGAAFMHQYIALLPSLQQAHESAVYLFFYPRYFTLCAFKSNKLNYINTIKYTTTEDVLYFVLNVCKQYEIENNVAVYCGGFIDEKSKLYDMLYQYLAGFQLLKADETQLTTDEFKEYSLHYFTPYINYVV